LARRCLAIALLLGQHIGTDQSSLDSIAALGVREALVLEQGVLLEVTLELAKETVVVTLDKTRLAALGMLSAPAKAQRGLRRHLLGLVRL
jgi:hypothetical protein